MLRWIYLINVVNMIREIPCWGSDLVAINIMNAT